LLSDGTNSELLCPTLEVIVNAIVKEENLGFTQANSSIQSRNQSERDTSYCLIGTLALKSIHELLFLL